MTHFDTETRLATSAVCIHIRGVTGNTSDHQPTTTTDSIISLLQFNSGIERAPSAMIRAPPPVRCDDCTYHPEPRKTA
jgi:hypothetical protein